MHKKSKEFENLRDAISQSKFQRWVSKTKEVELQNISLGFLLGFTGNAILTRLTGYRSMDDIGYPILLFILVIVMIICNAIDKKIIA